MVINFFYVLGFYGVVLKKAFVHQTTFSNWLTLAYVQLRQNWYRGPGTICEGAQDVLRNKFIPTQLTALPWPF